MSSSWSCGTSVEPVSCVQATRPPAATLAEPDLRNKALSMAGWLRCAKKCGVTTDGTHLSMCNEFSSKGWGEEEPREPSPQEHPRLFVQLVYRALAEQHISEAKAVELLGIPMLRFYKERQLASSDAVAITGRSSGKVLISRERNDVHE